MRLNIHLPDDIGQKLDQVSKATGASKTSLVLNALGKHLPESAPPVGQTALKRSYVRRVAISSARVIPTTVIGLTHHVTPDGVWFDFDSVIANLGIYPYLVLPEMDDEDIKLIGGKTCLSFYGVQSAMSIAKREGLDPEGFEALLDSTMQAINQETT